MLSPSYGQDELGAQSIWNRYLLAVWNGSALVFLTTTVIWGFNWQRAVAALLALIALGGFLLGFVYFLPRYL